MDKQLKRVFEAAGCRTQKELARILGIQQSSVSDAKRRASIPSDWLITLFKLRKINPEWIVTGNGPKFVVLSDDPDTIPIHQPGEELTPFQEILRCFSAKELADELIRRITDREAA